MTVPRYGGDLLYKKKKKKENIVRGRGIWRSPE